MSETIYLDHAAATPVADEVLRAMMPYFSDNFYNPSANYLSATAARQALERARHQVAMILGTKPRSIIFTAGATEANNLAIRGVMSKFPSANLVISAVEHESVLAPAEQFDCREAPVMADGRVDMPELASKIDDNTALVCVMYANNEIGTIQPLKAVAQLIREERLNRQKAGNKLPIYLFSDAAQAANYLDLQVSRLGVDMMSLNGGKIYGPKQSGALYLAREVELNPLISGGGQERNLRSGTENVAGSIGFAEALKLADSMRKGEAERLAGLQKYFFDELAKSFPKATINGSIKHRLPNNLHFSLPGQDNERLVFALDEVDIMVATGSACSINKDSSSHVLRAIGVNEADARSSLRLTIGRATTIAQLDLVLVTLTKLTI